MSTALASAPARATFVYQDANVELSASSADELLAALERFGIKAKAPAATATKSPTPSKPAPEADKTEGNVSASMPPAAQASAPAAGSGSTEGAGSPHPFNYNDVSARVVGIVKRADLGKDRALALLKEFGVDHANKLQLEQYAPFVAKADEMLGSAA